MVRRRIRGKIAGEHQEGDDQPQELNRDVDVIADTDLGATIVGDEVIRGKRFAIASAYMLALIIQKEQADHYANREVQSFFKQKGDSPQTTIHGASVPPGYQVCPSCSTGLTDAEDCGVCDCAGMLRLKDVDEDQTFYDDN